jgi:hypothetical protein
MVRLLRWLIPKDLLHQFLQHCIYIAVVQVERSPIDSGFFAEIGNRDFIKRHLLQQLQQNLLDICFGLHCPGVCFLHKPCTALPVLNLLYTVFRKTQGLL